MTTSHISFPILQEIYNLPFQVIGARVNYNQINIDRPSGYRYDQIVWFSEGAGVLELQSTTYQITKGTVFYLPKDIPHKYYRSTDRLISNWICFSGWGLEHLLTNLSLTEFHHFSINNSTYFVDLFQQINHEIRKDTLSSITTVSAYLYSMLIEVHQIISTPNCIMLSDPLKLIMNYIDENFYLKITMNDLCDISSLSESHLCRLFRQKIHLRPMEYIEQKRIRKAKELLLLTDDKIADISEKVGYNNAAYFTMLFRQAVGMTPSDFRRTMI